MESVRIPPGFIVRPLVRSLGVGPRFWGCRCAGEMLIDKSRGRRRSNPASPPRGEALEIGVLVQEREAEAVQPGHGLGRADLPWESVGQAVESADCFCFVTLTGREWIPKHPLQAFLPPSSSRGCCDRKWHRIDNRRLGRTLDMPPPDRNARTESLRQADHRGNRARCGEPSRPSPGQCAEDIESPSCGAYTWV